MSFCPYCGKQVEAGEICSCATAGNAQQPAPSYIGAPAAPRPAAPRPAAPRPVTPRPAAAGAETPRAAETYPAPSSAPQQTTYAPRPQQPAAPRERIPDPAEDRYYAPAPRLERDFSDVQDDFFAPQESYAPKAEDEYMPRTDARLSDDAAPAATGFVGDLTDLLARVTKLFKGKSDEALKESVESDGASWLAVFGAYVLFGTLAACFAIPRFLANVAGDFIQGILGSFGSGVIKYVDVLSASFGGVLWRSLLINLLTVGIIIGAVLVICKVNKTRLPMSGVLNLAGIAFVPAAALNVLGFLFSFFFPVGTMLCGVISAVCTVVIVLTALSDHCGKRSLWTDIIAVCAIIVVYVLLTMLLMDGFLPGIFAGGSSGSYMPF